MDYAVLLVCTLRLENVKVLAPQSCVTACDPMDCSPGSSVHGILQARILEWIFLTQGSNPCLLRLLYCSWILLPLSHQGSYFTFIWPQNDSWEVSGASLRDQAIELYQSIFTGLQQNEEKF